MWSKLYSYIRYLIKAQTKYSIHSPFIYDLITLCLEKPINKNLLQKFLNYKKTLLCSKTVIKISDFGAGSKVFKTDIRKVSDMANIAGMNTKKAKMVLKLVDYYDPKNILEIGTSLGIGTSAIMLAAPKSQITTLEGCPNTAQIAHKYWKQHNLNNATLVEGEFSINLPKVLKNQFFDLVYFDGNHQMQPTIQYFNACLDRVQNDTLFIFDDIHWSKEMELAWQEICRNPQVIVSIDLYHLGLVFFKKELSKQHFILWYG